jgi:aminomethyltransferase
MASRASPIAAHEARTAGFGERDDCITTAVYTSTEAEYRCLRERVGIQDFSHYGKFAVSGDRALDLINHLILTDLARLPINQVQYSFMLDDGARPICELHIANMGSHFLLLSEGAAPAVIEARLAEAAPRFPGAMVANRSDELALVSVDGPYSWELLKTFLGLGIIGTRYLEVVPDQSIGDVTVTLCRAGKTGEFGYMLIAAADQSIALWDALKTAGERFNLLPIGFHALDLCKMENRVVSQHNEGALVSNVLELNTRVMFGRDKEDFAGRDVLQSVMDHGLSCRVVGVTFDKDLSAGQHGIAPGAGLSAHGQPVGSLVNAGYSFGLGRWIGLALIQEEFACVGVQYDVQTPQGAHAISTVSAPFLLNRSLTIRPQEDSFFA